MTRTRLAALLPLLALLLLPGAAHATTTIDDVAQALRSDALYVDPQADVPLDEDAIRNALQSSSVPIYVAVLPERAGSLRGLVADLLPELPDDAVVFAINDQPDIRVDQNSGADALGVFSGQALERATSTAPREFTEASVNQRVLGFVDAVNAQASGESVPGAAIPGQRRPVSGGGSGGGAVLGVLALAAVGGGAFLYARTRKQQSRALQDARADVESLYGRLGSDVQLLAPGDDAIARQALADAAERYNATGALMAKADTPGEFAAARRTAIEGITAARVVRERLGLDPGPDLPMPATSAPQLTEPSRVRVEDEEYEGSPTYTPGRPHYYEGGYYGGRAIPGGWYATPFWQTLLLGSMLGGGMGRRRGHGGIYVGGGIGGFGGRSSGRRGGGGFGGFGGGRGGGGWGGGRGGGGFGGGGRGGGGW